MNFRDKVWALNFANKLLNNDITLRQAFALFKQCSTSGLRELRAYWSHYDHTHLLAEMLQTIIVYLDDVQNYIVSDHIDKQKEVHNV